MFRDVVCLLLLPLVLLPHAATFGHCHGGESSLGHDARPHLHLNSLCCSWHSDRQEAEEPFEYGIGSLPWFDHDHDAIYLSTETLVPGQSFGKRLDDAVRLALLPTALLVDAATIARRHPARWDAPPPPIMLFCCPLYLRLLTILV